MKSGRNVLPFPKTACVVQGKKPSFPVLVQSDKGPNSEDMCKIRLGEAYSAFISGDIDEKAYQAIVARGGRLPRPPGVKI